MVSQKDGFKHLLKFRNSVKIRAFAKVPLSAKRPVCEHFTPERFTRFMRPMPGLCPVNFDIKLRADSSEKTIC